MTLLQKEWHDKYRKAVDIVLESIISKTKGVQKYELEWKLMQKLLDENQKLLDYVLDEQ